MILNSYAFLKKVCYLKDNLRVYVYKKDSEISKISLLLIYVTYTNVFNEEADTTLLSHKNELNHNINLKSDYIVSFKSLYNLSEYKLKILKKYLNKNLQSEFITHSKSFAEALILFIKKKDSSLQLCVNY